MPLLFEGDKKQTKKGVENNRVSACGGMDT
jgi:hypothetical protein